MIEQQSKIEILVGVCHALRLQIKRLKDINRGLVIQNERLLKQQLDVQWEIDADESGLSKEQQEYVIKSADEIFDAVDKEKSYIKNLEKENKQLRQRLGI